MYARLLITLALLAAGASAQPPSEPKPRWLVELADRSFDLEGFRAAVTSGAPADRVADLVRDLESRARADQGELAAWIVARGGRVHAQWWLVNGLCAIDEHGNLAFSSKMYVDDMVAVPAAIVAQWPECMHADAP